MHIFMLRGINIKLFQIIVCIYLLLQSSMAIANILVVAPHPDDEALMASGIIYNSLQNGEEIKIVVMTNGDYTGINSGYTRQDETISGMVGVLGMQENNIIFLGYPDAGLNEINTQYLSSSSIYTSTAGQTHTYGRRGLGGTDYHSYRFGAPANYNKPNIMMDLESVISGFMPDHIFITSEYDDHTDHVATYLLVRESVGNVANLHSTYRPIIHKSIIWGGWYSDWPNPVDPNTLFSIPLNLGGKPVDWNDRESINVPQAMREPDLAQNLKYQSILAYTSQVGSPPNPHAINFVHKDEFFWAECSVSSNQPPVARPGTDQSVSTGTSVVLDGSGSRDPEGTPISYQWVQVHGTPVSLSNASTPTPSFLAPPVSSSETLLFRLTVSDGNLSSFPNTVSVLVTGTGMGINIAPLSMVTASSQNIDTGQIAANAVDGVVDGWPGDYTREWATAGQLAGAWIHLEWSTFQNVYRIRLYDRPNLTDQVLTGTLIFSDGSSISVGALPNNGTALTVDFPMKSVAWVNFNIDSAAGENIGLAEIEVFRADSSPGNAPPSITSGPTASPSTITDALTSRLSVSAADSDGDALNYSWSATGGSVSGTGATAVYTPPRVTVTTVYRVEVLVSDGRGGSVSSSVNVTVNPRPNTPPSITSGPTATPRQIYDNRTSVLSVTASDADGDPLSYAWSATGGRLSGTGATTVYTPPRVTVTTVYRVSVVVSDGRGGSTSGFVDVTVKRRR